MIKYNDIRCKYKEKIEIILYMPFDKIEETIEKYSNECIDKNNNAIKNENCNKMLIYLQQTILHKSRSRELNKK